MATNSIAKFPEQTLFWVKLDKYLGWYLVTHTNHDSTAILIHNRWWTPEQLAEAGAVWSVDRKTEYDFFGQQL